MSKWFTPYEDTDGSIGFDPLDGSPHEQPPGTVLVEYDTGRYVEGWEGYRLHYVRQSGVLAHLSPGWWRPDELDTDAFTEAVLAALDGDFASPDVWPRDPNGRKRGNTSPSQVSRWFQCPAAVRMADEMPVEDTSNAYADEGTTAHALAEHALAFGLEPLDLVGYDAGLGFVADEKMARHVQVYVDAIRGDLAADDGCLLFIEASLTVDVGIGWIPGSADAVVVNPASKTLHVYDLKYGQGVLVDVEDNKQLMTYGLGALSRYAPISGIDTVDIVVVQPRRADRYAEGDGYVRRQAFTSDEMARWHHELTTKYAETQSDDPAFGPSESACRWCSAAPYCKALETQALDTVNAFFDDVSDVDPAKAPDKHEVAAMAADMSPERLGRLLALEPVAKLFWREVAKAVANRLHSGDEVPGFKLVENRGYRAWVLGDDEVVERVTKTFGLDAEVCFEKKVLTAPKMEKVLKKALPKAERPTIETFYEQFVDRPLLDPKVVPESDSRPALVVNVDEMFESV